MTLRFDHAIILVNDLKSAIQDYQELGFNPFFGGKHAGGKTHNALIVLQDGSYLELLAPTRPELLQSVDSNDRSSFLFMFQYGEGFGGFALLSPDLAAETTAMQARGLNAQLQPPGGRARPDGQELRWRSATYGGSMTPFFLQDDTPRVLRVPNDADITRQPNGVTGVSGLLVHTSDVEATAKRYQAMLGVKADEGRPFFRLGDFMIQLLQNDVPDDHLAALILDGTETRTLDTQLTHGAKLAILG